jgi:hypothetical protein
MKLAVARWWEGLFAARPIPAQTFSPPRLVVYKVHSLRCQLCGKPLMDGELLVREEAIGEGWSKLTHATCAGVEATTAPSTSSDPPKPEIVNGITFSEWALPFLLRHK